MAKKQTELQRWDTRIRAGKKRSEEREKDWRRRSRKYSGHQRQSGRRRDRPNINIIMPMVMNFMAQTQLRDPEIIAQSYENPNVEDSLPIIEAVLNRYFDKLSVCRIMQRVGLDAHLKDFGVIKVGYLYDDSMADTRDTIMFPANDPTNADSPFEPQVKVDSPFVARVAPRNFITDEEAEDDYQLRWCCERMIKPLDTVRKAFRVRGKLPTISFSEGQASRDEDLFPRAGESSIDEETEKVELWEVTDFENERLYNVVPGFPKFLRRGKLEGPFATGGHYVKLDFIPRPDSWHSMGIAEALEPLQDEKNKIRALMLETLYRFLPKVVGPKNVNQREAEEFMRSQLAGFMRSNAPADWKVLTFPQQSFDAMQMMSMLENDLRQVSGLSENQRGGVPRRMTAKESSIIDYWAGVRSTWMRDQVEHAYVRIAMKLYEILRTFGPSETSPSEIRVQNMDPQFQQWHKGMLEEGVDFKIQVGSTQPTDEAVQKKQSSDLFNTLAPYANTGRIEIGELAKQLLKAHNVRNVDRIVLPPPPPMPEMPPEGAPASPARSGAELYQEGVPDNGKIAQQAGV